MDNSGPSDLQWSSLMDHIREDQEMLHGVYLHPGGKNRLKKKWETLAILVNNVDIASAQKTGPQWKSAWSSLKGRARKAYRDKVGPRVPGQPLPDPAVVVGLSDHHRRVLAMIGLQNIMGHNQVPQVDDENIDQPAALAAIAPAAEGHPQHAANDMPPAVLAPNAAIPAAEGHLQQAANDVPPAVPAPYAAIPAAEGHLQQAANDVPPAVPAPHAAIAAAEGHLQQAANDVPPAVPAPHAAIPAAEGHLQQAANDVPPAVPAPHAAMPAAEGHPQHAPDDLPPAVPPAQAVIPADPQHAQGAIARVLPMQPAAAIAEEAVGAAAAILIPKEEAMGVAGHWSPLGGHWPDGCNLFIFDSDEEVEPQEGAAALQPAVKCETEAVIDVITIDDTPIRPMIHTPPRGSGVTPVAKRRLALAEASHGQQSPQQLSEATVTAVNIGAVIQENTRVMRELLRHLRSMNTDPY